MAQNVTHLLRHVDPELHPVPAYEDFTEEEWQDWCSLTATALLNPGALPALERHAHSTTNTEDGAVVARALRNTARVQTRMATLRMQLQQSFLARLKAGEACIQALLEALRPPAFAALGTRTNAYCALTNATAPTPLIEVRVVRPFSGSQRTEIFSVALRLMTLVNAIYLLGSWRSLATEYMQTQLDRQHNVEQWIARLPTPPLQELRVHVNGSRRYLHIVIHRLRALLL